MSEAIKTIDFLKASNSEKYHHFEKTENIEDILEYQKTVLRSIMLQYSDEHQNIKVSSIEDIVFIIQELFALKSIPLIHFPPLSWYEELKMVTLDDMNPKRSDSTITKRDLIISLLREV